MANEIDLIVGSEAFAQITKLLVELGKVDSTFTELSAKFAALGSNTNTVKSTADLAKLTAENAKLNAVIEQQIKDFTDLNAKLAQATTARTSTTKAVTEATIAQRELNAQTTLNIKATTDAVGAYAKLDAQHKLAVKTAQDLAVATGRTGQAYEDAKNKANELGGRLRVIDTDIGKHTRNVGNYSSSWNGLGNSINQLTREAPAFANSVQTGFMALSNNIPILADEINNLKIKNQELAASGKPTQSIFGSLATAFFSWQTALSVGVTLLTLYGGKLIDFITGADKTKKALEAEKKALDDKNKALEESRTILANYQSEEISKSKILFETAKNLNLSYKEREKAVNQLKERYPDYLKELSNEMILAGDTAEAEELLNTALVKRGVALAAQQEIQKIISDNLKNEKKLSDELLNIENKRREINEKLGSGDVFAKEGSASKKMADERNLQLGRLYYLEETVNEQYKTRKATIQDTLKFYLDQYNQNSKFLDVVKETNSVAKTYTFTIPAASAGTYTVSTWDSSLSSYVVLKAASGLLYKSNVASVIVA